MQHFARIIGFDAANLCWLQRFGDKGLDVGRPRNDIHLFIVQFANNIFHPLTAQTHARAHGINFRIARINGHLRAKTRFARDAFDFNGAVADLRNFHRKQFYDEFRVGAG